MKAKVKVLLYCFNLIKKFKLWFIFNLIMLAFTSSQTIYNILSTKEFSIIDIIIAILSGVSLISAIVSFLKFVQETIGYNNLLDLHIEDASDFLNVNPPNDTDMDYIMLETSGDRICYSKKTNAFLQKNKKHISTNIDKKKYCKLRKNLSENYKKFIPYLACMARDCQNKDQKFNNDKKLCLSSDILPNISSVSFHYGGYYDTFLTNISCCKILKSNITLNEECDKVKFPSDRDGNLKLIQNSEMNDEIGVSTLAITSDNHIVMFTQNLKAAFACNKIVPSGSGSCDSSDFVNNSFKDTIIFAMNRELREEACLQTKYKDNPQCFKTEIIGYFRWMKKGGKPEFVGITLLDKICKSDIQCQRYEVCQYEGNVSNEINCKEDLIYFIDQMLEKDNLSIPLIAIFVFLKEYLNSKEKTALERFIEENHKNKIKKYNGQTS